MERVVVGVISECKLERNRFGLYDLEIKDEAGRLIVIERNIAFARAMSVIDEHMSGRPEPRAEVWP